MIDSDSILSRINKLNEIDSQRRIFASHRHQYRFNPCLERESVLGFEKKHAISLPEDYREFLLKVGNGGAGPGYGLLPLERFYFAGEWAQYICKIHYGGTFDLDDADPLFLSKPFPHTEFDFDNADAAPSKGSDLTREDYIKGFNYDIQGSIALCDHGCGSHAILVVSGPEKGKVWYEHRSEGRGMGFTSDSFTQWYDGWLDRSISEVREFWSKRDMMVGKVTAIEASGYGRTITVKLDHNNRELIFSYTQHDEFIHPGESSQKIKTGDLLHFSLYIDNVVPKPSDKDNNLMQAGEKTHYVVYSEVHRITGRSSFLCPVHALSKMIMIKTPRDAVEGAGYQFAAEGTLYADLYKIERY